MMKNSLIPVWVLGLTACLLTLPKPVTTQTAPAATLTWPNAESKANSDDWLRLHHNEIRRMRPRVLVLNFANGLTADEVKNRAESVADAVKEASRYHGYKDKDAPPFIEYNLTKIINLTDEEPLPDDQKMEGNSSLYPRVPDWKSGNNFRYSELLSPEFTQNMKFADPDKPTNLLGISDLVARGMVHEIWIVAQEGNFGAPYPCVEVKQAYNVDGRKITGKSVQAGDGSADEMPFLGRSLRVLYINPNRGAGCALEKLSRAFEETARSKALPYLSRYFAEFAGEDLKTRYRITMNSLAERQSGTDIEYPAPNILQYRYKGEQFALRNYTAAAGSVRFPPNARREFDTENKKPVLSTIEHFRLRDGTEGRDKAEPWTSDKLAPYRAVAPDCVGAWMVFWRQSMPGLNNKALDDTGRPMKNWWVYLYY
jgi:hypothetical protein